MSELDRGWAAANALLAEMKRRANVDPMYVFEVMERQLQEARAENKRLREALEAIASDYGPPEWLSGFDELYGWAQECAQDALKGTDDANHST